MWISKKRYEEITKKNVELSNEIFRLRITIGELLLKTSTFQVGDMVALRSSNSTKTAENSGFKVIRKYTHESCGGLIIRYTIIKDTILLEYDEERLIKEVQNEQRTDI